MTVTGRSASVERNTNETRVRVQLGMDTALPVDIQTPLPFLSHMLSAFACHGRFSLGISSQGDVDVDPHHLIEDTGIVLGQAIKQALNGYRGIQRAGCFAFPMDGSLALVAIDLCGRSNLTWNVKFNQLPVGNLDPNLFREFFKGMADGMAGTLHVHVPCSDNDHHVIEATFKAFGRALREAVVLTGSTEPLSTKGSIEA